MKWSSSTLKAAAEIQARIERLQQTLAGLLQTDGSADGPLETRGIAAPNGDGGPLSPSEMLEEALFWGNGFTPSKANQSRQVPIYHLQGLKRLDSGRLLTGLESPLGTNSPGGAE
jgi:hypothetical protein